MGDLHQRHKSESVSGMAEQVGQRLTSAIEGPVFAFNRCMLLGERLGGVDTGKRMQEKLGGRGMVWAYNESSYM